MTDPNHDLRPDSDIVDEVLDVEEPEQHTEAFVDADDTHETPEALETVRIDLDANKLGEAIGKAASDTAYATVGLVGLLSDRVKEYYEEQKRAYAAEHPDEEQPNAKHLLSQFSGQLDRFVDDVGRTFRDLVERGRAGAKQASADLAEGAEDLADQADAAAHRAADDLGEAAHDVSDQVGEAAHDVSDQVGEAAEATSGNADETWATQKPTL